MDDYDVVVVAGDAQFWLSQCLYDLAVDVGIPSPLFFGKVHYCDYNGAEKWQITTLIKKRTADPLDFDLEYTKFYPDFDCSIGMAIHGAISRICKKYRARITHGSVFRLFAERGMTGEVIYRSDQ